MSKPKRQVAPKPKRQKLSPALEISLATQVSSACPKCGKPLFYEKSGRQHRAYEIAHIYPLNPTPAEEALLAGELRLHKDVNHPDNLIPLCERCHGIFDKPRTIEEYRELYELKSKLIREFSQIEIRADFPLELGLRTIVDALHRHDGEPSDETALSYNPKSVDQKLNETMAPIKRRKIKRDVADYYQFIKEQFLELEEDDPNSSELIFSQVKLYYLKQKSLNISQQEIYENIVSWLHTKSSSETKEAAEIVASFFVQNCEVFE